MARRKNVLCFQQARVGRPKPENDPCITISDVLDDAIAGFSWRWGDNEDGQELVARWELLGSEIELGVMGDGVEYRKIRVMLANLADGAAFRCPCMSCLRKTASLHALREIGVFECLRCHLNRRRTRRRRKVDFLAVKAVIAREAVFETCIFDISMSAGENFANG